MERATLSARRRELWRRGALAASGTVAGLLLAELVIRLLGLAPAPGLFTVTEEEFRSIPGIFAPGQSVTVNPDTPFEHTATINQLGYRGRDFPISSAPRELRVLYAGDSFTWGHNVNDHETTPAQLEARLTEICGSAVVANAGLSGSSILTQENMIRRGLAIEPDIVVLMHHENDIDELIHTRIWEQIARNRAVKSRFPLSLIYPVVRTSALWNVAQEMRRIFYFRFQDEARTQNIEEDPQDASDAAPVIEARAEYRRRLTALKNLLEREGVGFVFVAFPHPESVRDGAGGRDYEWVVRTAREVGVSTIDLLPLIAGGPLGVSEAYLVPGDYHPSPAGHGFAAAAIADLVSGELSDAMPCRTHAH